MSTIVMSVNAGSSSLKFRVFKMPEEEVLATGNIERIGLEDAIFGMEVNDEKIKDVMPILDHGQAVEKLMKELVDKEHDNVSIEPYVPKEEKYTYRFKNA